MAKHRMERCVCWKILNAIGSEQKDRKNRQSNVILVGVPESTATSGEEREKEKRKRQFKPSLIKDTFKVKDNVRLSLIDA
jgi:predicted secreted protein